MELRSHVYEFGIVDRITDGLYGTLPWSRTILLAGILNDTDALELACIQLQSDTQEVVCDFLALSGNLPALKWARAEKQPRGEVADTGVPEKRLRRSPFPWNELTCAMAARGGYLSMLKWMRENECPWDSKTCSEAGKTGHLEVLKWIRGQHPRWLLKANKSAARYGHLHVLEWLLQEKWLSDPTSCSEQAARGGHLNVLKWLLELDCCSPLEMCSRSFRYRVVKSGSLEVIQWFRSKVSSGEIVDNNFASDAAYCGHLHILEWLHEEYKRPFNEEQARGIPPSVLKELLRGRRLNRPFDEECCAEASRGGHLNVLKWLRERGCPWDKYTTYYARSGGFEEIFEWASSHGCPYDDDCDGERTESEPDYGHDAICWADWKEGDDILFQERLIDWMREHGNND